MFVCLDNRFKRHLKQTKPVDDLTKDKLADAGAVPASSSIRALRLNRRAFLFAIYIV